MSPGSIVQIVLGLTLVAVGIFVHDGPASKGSFLAALGVGMVLGWLISLVTDIFTD